MLALKDPLLPGLRPKWRLHSVSDTLPDAVLSLPESVPKVIRDRMEDALDHTGIFLK